MKKELLIASALVSTMGVASVAEAVTATMSGNHNTGMEFDSNNSTTVDTNSHNYSSSFSVSLSETTDGGMTVSSSFMLQNEGGGLDNDNGLTLEFTDGSKLDLISAGNAAAGHDVSVPGAAGEEGVTITTTNNAPTGLAFAAGSTVLGVEWHSAADFMADGLKVSASYSADNGAAKTATAKLDNSWGVGATYVTDAGDTAVTIGAGISGGEIKRTGVQLTGDKEGFHAGLTAVTGNLTIGFGFADGDTFADDGAIGTVNASPANTQVDGSVVKAGISYVSGDITLAIGTVAGEAKDSTTIGTAGTTDDSHDATSASVTYAVASGVSAVLGYTTVDQNNEGTSTTDGGSAWYVGATLSF
jgi:hypothetical protein